MVSPAEERSGLVATLEGAAALLDGAMDVRLVPAGGGNIGYALRGARDTGDIAAITGGLRVDGGQVSPAGPVAFGADDRISRIILTVLKFDRLVRSAALIRYSGESFRILSEMFIESAEADTTRHPGGISTMDWAVASCCSEGVPEVIAIRAEDPDRQFICIFGEEPAAIARNIIILSNRIQ
jgi:hydroxymethylpyrimidine/phosphomethylpyrimidine kinase